MNLLPRIKEVLDSKPDEMQLDKFLSDVRESLATSNKQFIGLSFLVVSALVTYHLVVYEGGSITALSYVKVPDATLFHRVFLVVPAALLAAVACIGYLRRCQREVYDFLAIGRCRIFGKTGLHDLRLPSDYILGLHFLSTQGGVLGSIIASIIGYLALTVFTFAPAAYVVRAAVENISVFGISDILTVAASFIAITLSVSSILVIWLATRIKTEA